MDQFSYLSVLLSIILGLAITQVLKGFRGLLLTSASRAAVFLYTAPFFVALGSYQFLGERLSALLRARLG